MKKIFNKKVVTNLLMIYIILQPIMDIYYLYMIPNIGATFGFSPATIIRFLVFFILVAIGFFSLKQKNKYKHLIVFCVIFVLYTIFHHINCINFNNVILGQNYYSFFDELFYLIRMLLPVVLIYITGNYKLSEAKICKTLYITTAIFSSIMIISNLFLFALPSYDGADKIAINFLQWFNNTTFSYKEIASKGIFHMANQISGTFVLLLPLLIYYFNKKKTFGKFIIICSLILSMMMLGTRVGAYGSIIIIVVMLIMYLFFTLIKKEMAFNKNMVLLNILFLVFALVLFNYAPIQGREFVHQDVSNETENPDFIEVDYNKQFLSLLSNRNDERLIKFMKKNSTKFLIPKKYLKSIYKAEDHLDFWIDVFSLPKEERDTTREIQKLITKDVFINNNSFLDNLFGIGSSRIRKGSIYIEQDILIQYYIMGVVGIVLFIGPYFISIIYAIINMIKNYKDKFNYKHWTLIFSILFTILCGMYSGNVLDELIVTTFLGFICGILINSSKNEEVVLNDDGKIKISIIVPVYNVEKYLRKCLISLVNQTLDNYEIIIVNDGSTDNSQTIIDEFKNEYPLLIKSFVKKNGGLSDARNYGIKQASGEYVGFVDSDDYVELDMFQKLYIKAKEQDFDMVVCDLVYDYGTKKVLASSNLYCDLYNKKQIKKNMINIYPAAWNKIYKRELLNDVKFKKGVWFEDVEFIYRLYPYINNIGYVDNYLLNYVQRSGAITKTYDERIFNHIDNWNGIIKYYKEHNFYNEYKKEIEYSYVRYLLATFIKQASKIPNRDMYEKAINDALENVNKTFPNYRKNIYMYKNGLKGLYLLFFNKKIGSILYRGK